jgi:AcrR family transcriptional regulator
MSREIEPKRKYELKKRADEMAKTHLRITEAAIELHGTVGPARTTLSAVAKRAGVERRTLYRHFPTEADLFAACSTHYMTANPWPDLDSWRAIHDPHKRLERALDELYAYYERTAPMYSNVLRDAELVDFARDAVAGTRSQRTASGDRMRRSSSPHSSKPHPPQAAAHPSSDGRALAFPLETSAWRRWEPNPASDSRFPVEEGIRGVAPRHPAWTTRGRPGPGPTTTRSWKRLRAFASSPR